MDLSPLLNPTLILGLVSGTIGFIVWLVRLESKNASNATTIARLEKELEKTVADLEKHRTNQDIHFNLRISTQVEQSNERRFQTIEQQLVQINQKLDRIAEKQ
jgi:uncharacterized membrane-anchored protein YhcB (DUF1043 family)